MIRHCIYGVDANPLAADLCRMSLWLEGHDAGLPLTFLDHRIKVGNSLVGATPELLDQGIPDGAFDPIGGDDKKIAPPAKKRNKEERAGQGVLWQPDRTGWRDLIHTFGEESLAIAELPEDEGGQVRKQRARYESYQRSEVEPARAGLDAWTAAFFWPLTPDAPEPPTSAVLRLPAGQSPALSPGQRREIARLREQVAIFHWPLEFPEVFDQGGFDCVLGNPPWERIKVQELEFFAERDTEIANASSKAARRKLIERLPETEHGGMLYSAFRQALRGAEGQSKFVRASARFPLTAVGDVNVYALFAEHDRSLLSGRGSAGIVVPTGIATDHTNRLFFQSLVDAASLDSILDFDNRAGFFPDVQGNVRFSLLTIAAVGVEDFRQAAQLTDSSHAYRPWRASHLTAPDIRLINPNTRTCPLFRTAMDFDLVRQIHGRVPVLVDETMMGANPWAVAFSAMFHMSDDSDLFATKEQLEQRGAVLRSNSFTAPANLWLPLYEAKLTAQFNHRSATFEGIPPERRFVIHAGTNELHPNDLQNPSTTALPRYWVPESALLDKRPNQEGWYVVFRNAISAIADSRSLVACAIPAVPVGNSLLLVLSTRTPHELAALLAGLNSLVADYILRQKATGGNLNFHILKQIPVPPPEAMANKCAWQPDQNELRWVTGHVLELSYTSWDMQPFARDLGYEGDPFSWDPDRRAVLRAELDAYYAALYGLTRNDLRYILDPKDVYGPDFPGETFRVLKDREEKEYGEYRTRRLVLEAWDRLGLEPRNRDGRYEVAPTHAAPTKRSRSNGNRQAKPPADVLLADPGRPSQQPLFLSPLETFASEQSDDAHSRSRALELALTHLRAGPMTARELARQIDDQAIDRRTLNSVLFNEGREHVEHDEATHTYRLKQTASQQP